MGTESVGRSGRSEEAEKRGPGVAVDLGKGGGGINKMLLGGGICSPGVWMERRGAGM